jgi:hypothetical protein
VPAVHLRQPVRPAEPLPGHPLHSVHVQWRRVPVAQRAALERLHRGLVLRSSVRLRADGVWHLRRDGGVRGAHGPPPSASTDSALLLPPSAAVPTRTLGASSTASAWTPRCARPRPPVNEARRGGAGTRSRYPRPSLSQAVRARVKQKAARRDATLARSRSPSGGPWRSPPSPGRFDDRASGAGRRGDRREPTCLIVRTCWGKIVEQEDFYFETARIVELDQALTRMGIEPTPAPAP